MLLRDAEIENGIKAMASPIWRAAGLEPNDVGIYLVQDNQLNSFVAGGQAIFLNSGLILKAENPNQLLGVIAHETGHIAGGHVLRAKEAMRNASIESIIAMVAAAGASVLGRSGAPLLGAQGVGERSFLQFSMAQEATADHAALNFLDRSCQSARGLLKFFEILQTGELLAGERQESWVRTHPLTQQRGSCRPGALLECPRPARLGRNAAADQSQAARLSRRPLEDARQLPGKRPLAARALCAGDRLLPHPEARQGIAGNRRADPGFPERSVLPRAEGADAVREWPGARRSAAL